MTPNGGGRAIVWIRRILGPLLAVGALYLTAIAQMSPHPLPGLGSLSASVFFAGLATPFAGTKRARVELVLLALALACAVVAALAVLSATALRRH